MRWIIVATLVATFCAASVFLRVVMQRDCGFCDTAPYPVLAPGQGHYDYAAASCAGKGVAQVASEFDAAPTAEAAAKGYVEHQYGDGSWPASSRDYEKAYEGCLVGFGVPRPPPPSEQELRRGNVGVAVPHLQGVRITRKVIGGVYHYVVVADSPRRLLQEGWMTPLLDSLDFRTQGAHPVRVHLYTSRGRLLFSAGLGDNGLTAWMHIYRYKFVTCGPAWYSYGQPQKLSRLFPCPQKPRMIGR